METQLLQLNIIKNSSHHIINKKFRDVLHTQRV